MQTIQQRRLTLRRTLFATACTLLVLVAGCADKSKQKAAAPPPAPDVMVAQVTQAAVPLIMEFSGTVKAIKTVDVIPRVSGYIDKRYFEEGTFIEEGDPLYLIDPRPFQIKLDAAEAQLERDKANVALWQSEEKRYTALAKKGAGSIEDKEKAIARQKESLATIDKDKADIENIKLQLSYTNIVASFSGRVEDTRINVGQLVHEQQDVLTTLVLVDPTYVVFDVSRSQSYEIQQLQRQGLGFKSWQDFKVELSLPDGSPYPHQGKLNFISAQVDDSTDTMEFRAEFPNPTEKVHEITLIPGQYVPVRLVVGENPDALLIPGSALVESQVGTQVYVVNKDNKVESRNVEVGQSYKQQWVINKGLKKGEQVIFEGVQKVRPGMAVKPQAAAAKKT